MNDIAKGYFSYTYYNGKIVGQYANRIANGQFTNVQKITGLRADHELS